MPGGVPRKKGARTKLKLLELFPLRRILFSRRGLFVAYLSLTPERNLCNEPRLRLGDVP